MFRTYHILEIYADFSANASQKVQCAMMFRKNPACRCPLSGPVFMHDIGPPTLQQGAELIVFDGLCQSV